MAFHGRSSCKSLHVGQLRVMEEERAKGADDILDGAGAIRLVDRGGKCFPHQEL